MSIDRQFIERLVWETLNEQANSTKATNVGEFFSAFGTTDDSLNNWVARKIIKQGIASNLQQLNRDYNFVSAIREVFYSAQHLGLIIPGLWDQSMDWNAGNGAYQFSSKGIFFFSNNFISLSDSSILIERVQEIISGRIIDPGVIALVGEAQKCWAMGCLRASMVLIGLASEEVCTRLLEVLCKHPSPPSRDNTLFAEWERLNNDAMSFYPKWQSGLILLESIKRGLKREYGSTKPEWWRIWEPLPGAVQPYAEAVRIARNTAAHSVEDIFTPAQVGLLLASLPTMIEVVSDLTVFLSEPPDGVSLPGF